MINPDKKFLNSFARRKARLNKAEREKYFTEKLEQIRIKDDLSNLGDHINSNDKYILEIGFGDGEHLHNLGKTKEDHKIIGSEVYEAGVLAFLKRKEEVQVNNISIYMEDCRILLEALEDNFFEEVYIMFPDPWPKTKHYKRRLIQKDFLRLLSSKVKKNGYLRIATDHKDYAVWIINQFSNQNYFSSLRGNFPYEEIESPNNLNKNLKSSIEIDENIKKDFISMPQNHIITKYQRKGIEEGREALYFEFINKKLS